MLFTMHNVTTIKPSSPEKIIQPAQIGHYEYSKFYYRELNNFFKTLIEKINKFKDRVDREWY